MEVTTASIVLLLTYSCCRNKFTCLNLERLICLSSIGIIVRIGEWK